MGDDVLVGIDIGSSRTKALAYDRAGTVVAERAVDTPTQRSADGLGFPVLAVLDAAEQALAEVVAAAGTVVGVGVASIGEVGTVVTAGHLADLLFPAWFDDRGAKVVASLGAARGERLATLTGGHWRPTSTLAKLAWLRTHQQCPPGTFLGVAGALVWRLTGAVRQEAGLASTSGAFDPVRRRYLHELWGAAGLGSVALPAVHREARAPARGAFADALGLRPGCPVVIAGHDHPVAAVGAGAGVGDVVNSVGTSEGMLVAVERGRVVRTGVGTLVRGGFTIEGWPAGDQLVVMAEGLRPGLAMRTLLHATGSSPDELDALAPAPGVAPEIGRRDSLALESGEPGSVTLSPTSWGSLVDHYARLAASQEERLRTATGAAGSTVLTGGGTRSARWVAAKRTFSRRPVAVSSVDETAARGCAAIVGTSVGWWPSPSAMPGLVWR